jgi:hypothetical protein
MVFDGLWRCLCPSVDQVSLARIVRSPSVLSNPLKPHPIHIPRSQRLPQVEASRRCFATKSPALYETLGADETPRERTSRRPRNATVDMLLRAEAPYRVLHDAALPTIYDALRQLKNHRDSYRKIAAFVRYLVSERDQVPQSFLYECLIRVLADTRGSADHLALLLDEMSCLNIHKSTALYHSALTV